MGIMAEGSGSLVHEYARRMEEYDVRIRDGDASAEGEKIEFMLEAAPFINRYYRKEPEKEEHADSSPTPNHGMHQFVNQNTAEQRGTLYHEYMHRVEGVWFNDPRSLRASEGICPRCSATLLLVPQEAIMSCPGCAHTETYMENSSRALTFEQETTSYVTGSVAYKRSNHLAEHLACIQAKESTNIPEDIIAAVRSELKKERNFDSSRLKPSKVKAILRKLHLSKFYEHSVMISYNISGVPPPVVDEATEEKFRSMFTDIQRSFAKHCPSNRKNFLSYSYCLYKMSQLIERDDLLPFFPLLKSREKLHEQDMIWRKICADLKYEYIPSI